MKKTNRVFLLFIVLSMSSTFISPIRASSDDALSYKAQNLYEAGKYEESLKLYQRLESSGVQSNALFYNMGKIHYLMGHLGEALFYHLKAERLSPMDEDTLYNVDYLRAQRKDNAKDLKAFDKWVSWWPFNYKKSQLIFLTLSLMFWGLLTLQIFKQSQWLRTGAVFLGLSYILSAVGLGLVHLKSYPFGVVTAEKARVYSETGMAKIELFVLNRGTEFKVIDTKNEWLRLKVPTGLSGWVSKDKIIFTL